jgi:hypothetical protein
MAVRPIPCVQLHTLATRGCYARADILRTNYVYLRTGLVLDHTMATGDQKYRTTMGIELQMNVLVT